MANGNAPANVAYIIVDNGFYYVAYKEKARVPEVVVSSKGIANGLSEEYNDGWDFGPDSYDPTSTASIPYTQTTGIQEAISYVFSNAVNFQYGGGGLLTKSIFLNGATFNVYQPLTLPAPSSSSPPLPNYHIYGQGLQTTVLVFHFNSSYGITISPDNSYGMFEFSDFSVMSGSGYTPSGWLNADWSSKNSGQTNLIMKNINVWPASWSTNSMVLNSAVYCLLINVWDTTSSTNTGPVLACEVNQWIGGVSYQPINVTNTVIGTFIVELQGLQNCPVSVTFGGALISVTDCMNFTLELGSVTVESLLIRNCHYPNLSSLSLTSVIYASSSSVIKYLSVEGLYTNVTQSVSLIDTSNLTVNKIKTEGLEAGSGSISIPSVTLLTNPPVSGTVYQNTNPYDIEIDLPVYATTSGTAGYVTIAKGATDTPTAIGNQYVSGDTSDTSEQIIRLRVPAGWYYEFTASGVTFGTASVFAD